MHLEVKGQRRTGNVRDTYMESQCKSNSNGLDTNLHRQTGKQSDPFIPSGLR